MSIRPFEWRSVSSWRQSLAAIRTPGALLVSFLGATLLVRLLTDDLSSPNSRHSGSLNLSGIIAVLYILLAASLLLRRRRGVLPSTLAVLWLCAWTAIAIHTSGASTETLREGVREASVVALAVIVYNAGGAVTVPIATRLIQLIGFAPALVALYQYATFTGTHRPYGTFAHPDSAAMFFAIAAIASLWRYLDDGRRRSDALLMALFALALIVTFSIDGLATLVAMLVTFGMLHPGARGVKLGPCVLAAALVLVFFATPLGAKRIAAESSTAVGATGEPDSSIAWRLKKWELLIPEWERSPIFGRGLGTTTTAEGPPGNVYDSKPPHNEYIRYLVETGVVGMLTLLGALTVLARGLIRRRRLPGTVAAGTFNAATLGIVIVLGCLVDSLADNTLLNSPSCYAAALIVIAVLACPSAERRRGRASALQAA
jgi:O-antigen ligase